MVKENENLALLLDGCNNLRLENRPIPEPKQNEVVVRVYGCGICGTDMHFISHGGLHLLRFDKPSCIGHEASGTVAKVGPGVTTVNVGDRVCLEPNDHCGMCWFCTQGRDQLCHKGSVFTEENRKLVSLQDGMLQQYTLYPEHLVNKLPDNVSLDAGSVAEPLACALHAVRRTPVQAGQTVLVTGAGPMGLLSALCARAFGATKIVITDTNPKRLEYAIKTCGLDDGYCVDLKKSEDETARELIKKIGKEPDVTLEATGFESAMRLAIAVTLKGGKVAMIGLGQSEVKVPLALASMKELDLIGAAKYDAHSFKFGLQLMAEGKIKPEVIVSHKVPLSDFPKAFDLIKTGEGVKVMLQP